MTFDSLHQSFAVKMTLFGTIGQNCKKAAFGAVFMFQNLCHNQNAKSK